ncbi:MAG: 4-hydroxy-3-methylbut-2-enyl diphosphate reductase [Candidatus Eisenbacteria sp.]|nr:4-hydroxy-3-methylbut-2-enyl diphosphate reductase [Candidatus Eisenbacteria bacterium]
MKVLVVKNAGFCFGVKRAIRIASEAARSRHGPVFTLGPLIHNPQVVRKLAKEGVVAVPSLDDMTKGTMVVRSHGLEPGVIEKARARGMEIVDATCPNVKNAQRYAARLAREGYLTAVVGEASHPEVQGILGHAGASSLVVAEERDVTCLEPREAIGVIAQTTLSQEYFSRIVSLMVEKTRELVVYNTICGWTASIQEATREVAEKAGVMVVVGGRNSANTTRLARICRRVGRPTYHIETVSELKTEWFASADSVGVTAGASTPEGLVKDVLSGLERIAEMAYDGGSH